MACDLTHIRRGTASTLKKVNNTRSQVLGNFILKMEERSDSSGGAENKSSIEMRKSPRTDESLLFSLLRIKFPST